MYGNRIKRRGGFTLTELMVVIGLIVVLMSILIPTVGAMRKKAYAARTQAFVQKLASACHAYFNDFQAYPGIIDDAQLYGSGSSIAPPTDATTGTKLDNITQSSPGAMQALGPITYVTSSENLLLSLVGGTKVAGGKFQFDLALVQSGGLQSLNPLNPKAFGAYVSYNANEISGGQFYNDFNDPGKYDRDSVIPEFLDAFPDPMPIVYIRARPGAKQIVGQGVPQGGQGDWQYNYQFLQPYWRQFGPPSGTNSPQFPTYDKQGNSGQPVYNDPMALFQSPSVFGQARSKDSFIIMAAGASRNYGTRDMIFSAD